MTFNQKLVFALVLAGIVSLTLVYQLPRQKKVQYPQVLRSELALKDGHVHKTNESMPFTGFMVEYYQTNRLQSRSMVLNGLLEGLSEGWHTNGQLEVHEFFKKGISHGVRTKWYPSGARLSESTIVEGQHDGTFRRWYENGTLAEEIEMKKGTPEGLSRSFYPSGCLKAQAHMTNGQPADQKSWKDGEQRLQ